MSVGVTRDQIPALHGGTSWFYAHWLSDGISRFMVDGKGRDSFPGAGNFVGWMGAIEDDLALIYDVLEEDEQRAFRSGIAIALAELPAGTKYWLPVARDLLRVAALVEAREVLNVIPSLVATADAAGSREAAAFCELAIDAAIELVLPSPEALDSLQAIASSPGFSPAVAGSALLAFAKAVPGEFATHLNALADELEQQYSPDRLGSADARSEEDRDALLIELAVIVPGTALARAYDPGARDHSLSSGWPAFDWFCRGLMESRDPLVAEIAEDVLERARHLRPKPALAFAPRPEPSPAADPFTWALGPRACFAGG